MNDVTIASSQADAEAAEAVGQHHAQMSGALAVKVEALAKIARSGKTPNWAADLTTAREDLVAWGRVELLPHAKAEEDTLYRAAAELSAGRLLVESMLAEHEAILGLVEDLARAEEPVGAAMAAGALRAVFETHLAKENEQILPLLVAAPSVSVAELLGGMHELLGGVEPVEEAVESDGHAEGHTCNCNEEDGASYPELDARVIPHAIRHATIFGALDTVRAGQGLVLVAPHDPLPLLAQLEKRAPGAFEIDYLERGPEAWRLSMVRVAS